MCFFLCVCYPYKIGGKNRIFFEEGGNFLLWFDFCRYFSLFPVRLLHKSPYPAPAACCCAVKCCLLNFLEMSFLRLKEPLCVGGRLVVTTRQVANSLQSPKEGKTKKKRASGKSFPKSSFRAEMEPVLRWAVKASMAVCGESQLQTGKNIFWSCRAVLLVIIREVLWPGRSRNLWPDVWRYRQIWLQEEERKILANLAKTIIISPGPSASRVSRRSESQRIIEHACLMPPQLDISRVPSPIST